MLKEVTTYIDTSDKKVRPPPPPDSGDQDIPTDEEDDVGVRALLPAEVAGELKLDFEE